MPRPFAAKTEPTPNVPPDEAIRVAEALSAIITPFLTNAATRTRLTAEDEETLRQARTAASDLARATPNGEAAEAGSLFHRFDSFLNGTHKVNISGEEIAIPNISVPHARLHLADLGAQLLAALASFLVRRREHLAKFNDTLSRQDADLARLLQQPQIAKALELFADLKRLNTPGSRHFGSYAIRNAERDVFSILGVFISIFASEVGEGHFHPSEMIAALSRREASQQRTATVPPPEPEAT